ncbi:MAG: glycosyltransferase [Bacteroidaceae bacterium]|nr:glycosyltransferase [Bacteroidaceae bacterium]
MIRFTIATVTFNAGTTLGRTLESVAAQTYEAVEHLIVDGCSTDGTMREIHRYVERNTDLRHPHSIILVREPDNGLYDAMNKAIAQAKGDYIIFLNAGDTFHDVTVLADVAEQIERRYNPSRHPAVIYGETDLVDEEGRFLRHRRLQAPERLTSRSFLSGMLVCHQSFYVRADIARATPYDLRFRFSADYDWCIRVMLRAERRNLALHNTRLILTDYLSEGMTTRNHRRSLLERLRLMAHHYGWARAIAAHAWFVIRAIVKR